MLYLKRNGKSEPGETYGLKYSEEGTIHLKISSSAFPSELVRLIAAEAVSDFGKVQGSVPAVSFTGRQPGSKYTMEN